mmetsp:Transcript_21332/g.36669  ORF Transcript_21332/g.36669 Transcript_21332/m.36669 type:complete len:110 (-) Transcript_21332:159-488(-)
MGTPSQIEQVVTPVPLQQSQYSISGLRLFGLISNFGLDPAPRVPTCGRKSSRNPANLEPLWSDMMITAALEEVQVDLLEVAVHEDEEVAAEPMNAMFGCMYICMYVECE